MELHTLRDPRTPLLSRVKPVPASVTTTSAAQTSATVDAVEHADFHPPPLDGLFAVHFKPPAAQVSAEDALATRLRPLPGGQAHIPQQALSYGSLDDATPVTVHIAQQAPDAERKSPPPQETATKAGSTKVAVAVAPDPKLAAARTSAEKRVVEALMAGEPAEIRGAVKDAAAVKASDPTGGNLFHKPQIEAAWENLFFGGSPDAVSAFVGDILTHAPEESRDCLSPKHDNGEDIRSDRWESWYFLERCCREQGWNAQNMGALVHEVLNSNLALQEKFHVLFCCTSLTGGAAGRAVSAEFAGWDVSEGVKAYIMPLEHQHRLSPYFSPRRAQLKHLIELCNPENRVLLKNRPELNDSCEAAGLRAVKLQLDGTMLCSARTALPALGQPTALEQIDRTQRGGRADPKLRDVNGLTFYSVSPQTLAVKPVGLSVRLSKLLN